MEKLQHLLNQEFEEGWQDCYSLAQKYYFEFMGVELKDYARPDRWFMVPDFAFFDRLFAKEGFEDMGTNPGNVVIGDAILMALGRTEVSNHVAIYVGRGQILHHLTGQKSRLDSYNVRWRERVTRVLRHPNSEFSFDNITAETMAQLPFSVRQQLKRRG